MIPGQTVSLFVERPAAGGWMIARAEGRVILVSGAIPGERVTARIDRVSKSVAYASTQTIEEPSPDRRQPSGDLRCGGCLYAHIDYSRQLALKALVVEDAFTRIGHLELPAPMRVRPSREDGYRMRARLHVRGRRIGFFRENSHDLCDPRVTRQLRPDTCDVLEDLAATFGALDADAMGELDVSENIEATERAICLDAERGPIDAQALRAAQPPAGVSGLAIGGEVVAGQPFVVDRVVVGERAFELRRDARAFFQGNRYLLHALVGHVVGETGTNGRLIDLYAGVGLFAIASAVATGAHVIAVEGDRIAARDLEFNARASGGAVETVHQPVETFARTVPSRPEVVIVDPPRTGMSREALDAVVGLDAGRVVYVSCDVATLARDARRLVDAGFGLTRADAFDLFPNTPHVETVVVFEKR